MRSHADENGVLHVTQCSHFDEDDDVVVVVVVAEEEGDVVEGDWGGAPVEGDSSLAETQLGEVLNFIALMTNDKIIQLSRVA